MVSVDVSAGSVPGGSGAHGHDHLQEHEGGTEDPGDSKEHRGDTCSPAMGRVEVTRGVEGLSLQQEGVGVSSTMVVEKKKLDGKVKEMKDRVQVEAPQLCCSGVMEAA